MSHEEEKEHEEKETAECENEAAAGDADNRNGVEKKDDSESSDAGEENIEDEEIDDNGNGDEASANKKQPRGTKRNKTSKSQSGPNKKQKAPSNGNSSKVADRSKPNGTAAAGKVGSKHDEPRDPNTRGSASRLPEVGQQVHWKALPGYVDGEVVEVLHKQKDVDGKTVKASEHDPRIVLKSNKSGKICVHKADAVYF